MYREAWFVNVLFSERLVVERYHTGAQIYLKYSVSCNRETRLLFFMEETVSRNFQIS